MSSYTPRPDPPASVAVQLTLTGTREPASWPLSAGAATGTFTTGAVASWLALTRRSTAGFCVVTQSAPSDAAAMPWPRMDVPARNGMLYAVMTPDVVTRPILAAPPMVTQRAPSGPAAIACGATTVAAV